MPPKRKKRYTQKQKKRTGRKQKNTTFKNTAQVGGRKSLEDALSEKLTDELVQKLIDYPDRKYSILIDFCSDNSFVVNTMKLLDESSLASEGVYTPYNNKLTISNDFEQGKLLEIIIKVDKDVIQYATTVKEKNESDNKFCIDDNLPVIYHIPEITTLDDKDLLSSTTLAPSISDEQPSGEVDLDDASRGPMSYEEITSPDFMPEQAQINMNDLVVEDLEDVSDSYIDSSVTAPSDDLSKELETKIDRLAHEARLRAEEEAQRKAEEEAQRKAEEEAKRKAEEDTKKKADEEAKRKAEEDAKKKADEEAKKKAEEDAKKKADEETRLKAEEDAKKKADDEAKKKADDEAKKKAEEDAKRKVEEETRLKVEEEAKRRKQQDRIQQN